MLTINDYFVREIKTENVLNLNNDTVVNVFTLIDRSWEGLANEQMVLKWLKLTMVQGHTKRDIF